MNSPGCRAERTADALSLAILVVVALVAILTFRDYGLGWDDYTHAEYGGLLLRLFGSGFTDRRAFSFVNLYAYGGGFDVLAALVAKFLPFGLFETRRLVGAVVGLIGLLLTWRLARRLGGPVAALIALALLATCPLYYGHMYINAKDVPFAVATAFLSLALVRAFAEYPKPDVPTITITGIAVGLAIGTRVLAGLAAIEAFAAFVLIATVEARHLGLRPAAARAGTFVLVLLPGLVVGYAVMALIWPWGVIDPLNPLRAAQYFAKFFEKPWQELFAGALIEVPDMPRIYVPQLFALNLPELFLVLAIGGVAGALVAAASGRVALPRRASFLYLALSGVFPILFAMVTRPAGYNGIRHFVFVLPALAVLAGLAGAWVLDRLVQAWRPGAVIAAAVLAVGLARPVIEMTRLHPYEYTHFNDLAGGVRSARSRYMLDYWGLSLKQAADALRDKLTAAGETRRPGNEPWRIAVCGPQRTVQVEFGPSAVTTWEPRDADFALSLGEFYCAKLDAPLVAEIVRDGVTYARVYDIRGRSIPTLLTLPPP